MRDQSQCPICRGPVNEIGIHVSLETDYAIVDGRVIKLGPILAPLLYTLSEHIYKFVSTSALNQSIYGDRWPETPVIYMHVRALRKSLDGTGWQVSTRRESTKTRSGDKKTGYMLSRVTEAKADPKKVAAAYQAIADLGISDDDAQDAMELILPRRT